jgi:cytidylate kinase
MAQQFFSQSANHNSIRTIWTNLPSYTHRLVPVIARSMHTPQSLLSNANSVNISSNSKQHSSQDSAAQLNPISTASSPSPYSQLENCFSRHVSADSLLQLASSTANNNNYYVLTLGGDQLTGKSTLAKNLQRLFAHSAIYSGGKIFRQLAQKMGISLPELSRRALNSPEIDVNIEFELCRVISGNSEHNTIAESRNAAVMGTFCKKILGKTNIIRVYLTCSVVEQAIRFIQREISPETAEIVAKELHKHAEGKFSSLTQIGKVLELLNLPGLGGIIQQFYDNDNRDNDDRQRFIKLYGKAPELDYRNPELYDIIINTTPNSPLQTFQQTVKKLSELGVKFDHLPPQVTNVSNSAVQQAAAKRPEQALGSKL